MKKPPVGFRWLKIGEKRQAGDGYYNKEAHCIHLTLPEYYGMPIQNEQTHVRPLVQTQGES